jgi:hypothetical protein
MYLQMDYKVQLFPNYITMSLTNITVMTCRHYVSKYIIIMLLIFLIMQPEAYVEFILYYVKYN